MSAGRYSGSKNSLSSISVEPFSVTDKTTPRKSDLRHSQAIRSTKDRDSSGNKKIYPSSEQRYDLEKKYRTLEQEKVLN